MIRIRKQKQPLFAQRLHHNSVKFWSILRVVFLIPPRVKRRSFLKYFPKLKFDDRKSAYPRKSWKISTRITDIFDTVSAMGYRKFEGKGNIV